MARVKRRQLNVLAGISLPLFVATAILWVFSLFFCFSVEWSNVSATRSRGFDCARGEMRIYKASNNSVTGLSVPGGLSCHLYAARSLTDLVNRLGPFAHFNFRFLGFGMLSIYVPGGGI